MGVSHAVPDLTKLNTDIPSQMINAGYLADHPGISEFRVGSVITTVLDTSKAVTFAMPFDDANYEVFIQANSNVGVSAYPSNFAPDGFTLNLSAGANANFSYFAVANVIPMAVVVPI